MKEKRDGVQLPELFLQAIFLVHSTVGGKMACLNMHYPRRPRESNLDYPYPVAGLNSNILPICSFTLS